jgi:hypothetical protein
MNSTITDNRDGKIKVKTKTFGVMTSISMVLTIAVAARSIIAVAITGLY